MTGLNDLCTKYTQSFKVHATVNEGFRNVGNFSKANDNVQKSVENVHANPAKGYCVPPLRC